MITQTGHTLYIKVFLNRQPRDSKLRTENIAYYTSTLKKSRNTTLFRWKIYGVLLKVIDRGDEPSSFQKMLMNFNKRVFEIITN